MNNSIIKIVIADDHTLFLEGINQMLNLNKELLIETVKNGQELLKILKEKNADLVILDINMPKLNGLETAKYLKESFPSVYILILSSYQENYIVEIAKKNGADGYIFKNCTKNELLNAIYTVTSGLKFFPTLKKENSTKVKIEDPFLLNFKLTQREIEIIGYLKENQTNKRIAEQLNLSVFTVETHRKNIMKKLGLKKPTELIRFVLEKGI